MLISLLHYINNSTNIVTQEKAIILHFSINDDEKVAYAVKYALDPGIIDPYNKKSYGPTLTCQIFRLDPNRNR